MIITMVLFAVFVIVFLALASFFYEDRVAKKFRAFNELSFHAAMEEQTESHDAFMAEMDNNYKKATAYLKRERGK